MADLAAKAQQEAARLERKFGHKAGATGAETFKLNVIPTGSLALDFALGTGGWPKGHPIEVFGPPDIGKSSVIGFNAIRNVQSQKGLCGIVALEPGFDKEWAIKNGVDPEGVVIGRPDTGEDAFAMLYDWVKSDLIDFILFDSIGAVLREAETNEDGKPAAMGQSALITWGVKRILTPCWKNNKGLIMLNQIRDDTRSRMPGVYDSPGGHALKHSAAVRVQLKQNGPPMKAKVEGEDVVIGRSLAAVIKRNKLAEGSDRRAEFDFYQMETDAHPVGIDWAKDVIATAIRTGVIQKGGAWYRHPSFPGDENRLQGKDAVGEFLASQPKVLDGLRDDVLRVMLERQEALKNTKPELEVVDGS